MKCDCYDGQFSEMTPGVLVSVRCAEHQDIPPLPHHSLMVIQNGKPIAEAPIGGVTPEIRQKCIAAKRRKNYVLSREAREARKKKVKE